MEGNIDLHDLIDVPLLHRLTHLPAHGAHSRQLILGELEASSAGSPPFQEAADGANLAGGIAGHASNDGATTRPHVDQSLESKLVERLTKGGTADLELVGEIRLDQ